MYRTRYVSPQGDMMFRNWRSIFTGNGGPINTRIPIYSFDGRDVLADPFWFVHFIYWICFLESVHLSTAVIFSVLFLLGLRRVFGTALPARGSAQQTSTVRHGEQTMYLSWASHQAWPQVCSWVRRLVAVPTNTLSCALRPTKTRKPPCPWISLLRGNPSELPLKLKPLGKDLSTPLRKGCHFQHIFGATCSILCSSFFFNSTFTLTTWMLLILTPFPLLASHKGFEAVTNCWHQQGISLEGKLRLGFCYTLELKSVCELLSEAMNRNDPLCCKAIQKISNLAHTIL